MAVAARYTDYDRFARIYNRHFGPDFAGRVLPVLDRLLLTALPARARLLDLCCGTGQLAAALSARGFAVTGLDGSEEMLRFARDNAPDVEFVIADGRAFELSRRYHAVLSVFDSLNHVMTLEELTAVFRNVHTVLLDPGLFVFDLNMDQGYRERWRGSFGIVEEDHVCVVRMRYRGEERIGATDVTMLFRRDGWQRSDLTLTQKCYSEEEILSALAVAGFGQVRTYDAHRELEFAGGIGRTFFRCRKPAAALSHSDVGRKDEVFCP